MRIYGSLQLNSNEIKNVSLEKLATDPATQDLYAGRYWYNTTEKVVKYFDGTSIKILATGGNLNDVIAELDATQAGAGLNTNGNYIVNSSANYISTATSLADADNKLDAALKTVSDNLAAEATARQNSDNAIQTEVNNIEAAAGLKADGTFDPFTGTNYLNTATSLKNASVLLDSQVKTVSDGLAQEILDRQAADATKVSKAGDTMTGSLSMSGNRITNVGTPVDAQDAVNKQYVDYAIQGMDWKESVRAATTSNITLSGLQTVDNVSLVVGDRVLVKNQTDKTKNGIYVVADGVWSRSADADGTPSNEVSSGLAVFVSEGIVNGGNSFVLVTPDPITLGTTELTFTQFNGAGQIIAGTGLSKLGNEIYINLGAGIKELPNDEVGVDLYAAGGLFLTTDGSTESSDPNAQIAIKLDGTTITRTANGIKVSDTVINQINTTAQDLATEITNRQNADAAIQAELDAVENAVGLKSDGTLEAYAGTNYLNSASTIKAATITLDTQLKTVSDNLAAEVTARQTADQAIRDDLASTAQNKGASLVGVYGSFTNASGASTVQQVLNSFDTAITNAGKRFLFTATSSGTSFEVNHNLGIKYCSVTVIDSVDDSVIIPESIIFNNENKLTVTFNTQSPVQPIIKVIA